MKKKSLTGIKPTGTPHIGNYLGAIKPAIELAQEYQALYFIADYHALTTVRDGRRLNELSYEVACTWLALGLDPSKVIFYRQSDIPELFEFAWILSCFTAKGLLNRAHAYKSAVEKNIESGKPADEGINAGLFNYPVLMAADIVLFGSHVVPVGLDQKQHVEIARDIAESFNNNYGDILTLPEPLINEELMTIPGLDGRKMSKNYDNTIQIFLPSNQLRKRVMRIVTDSKTPDEPKDPDQDNVFAIYRYFASAAEIEETHRRYQQGGLAYSEIKQELFELLDRTFSEAREKYNALMEDRTYVDRVLSEGADKARAMSGEMMRKIRKAVGVGTMSKFKTKA
ncbi:MAG TPA: tryptophan--tRNA ligase [Pyrinomonadaceae bacterium]|jgi:tryptophanyl-tRNA synthetase|nr:tryptophan--tRNA ligase [Pyrinomonadaceae bacterium]